MSKKSLQDQLLNAGLVSENKAKQMRSEKRKKKKQKGNDAVASDAALSVQQKKQAQAEKDRQLNEEQKKSAETQALLHQIKHLIEQNHEALPPPDEAIPYHFSYQGKVKTLYISSEQKNKLIAAKLAIAIVMDQFYLVSVQTADKLKQRSPQSVAVLLSEEPKTQENDDYKGFEVPDDLIW